MRMSDWSSDVCSSDLALMEASPAVVTRQELETRVWGEELPDSDSLRVHIHGLRAVVDKPFPILLIQTRHGIGYRLAEPDASTLARTGAPAPLPAAAEPPPHPVVGHFRVRPGGAWMGRATVGEEVCVDM